MYHETQNTTAQLRNNMTTEDNEGCFLKFLTVRGYYHSLKQVGQSTNVCLISDTGVILTTHNQSDVEKTTDVHEIK